MSPRLTLWDTEEPPPRQEDAIVLLWRGHSDRDGGQSVLRYAEAHAERLRGKYLAWIHELGQAAVAGRRVIDHLALEPGLSFWWLTSLVEKNPYRAPISDVVRLFAVEELLVQYAPESVRVVTRDPRVAEVLVRLCADLELPCEWVGSAHSVSRARQRTSFAALTALARHLRTAWPYRRSHRSPWYGGERTVFFCDYFVNVVATAADKGRFYSRYWETLPQLLEELGWKENWLHHNVRPPAATALAWIERFNARRDTEGYHVILDTFLSWRAVARVAARWRNLRAASRRIGEALQDFRSSGSRLVLWPMIREEWKRALTGAPAVDALLAIELFDAALRHLPHQTVGLYLCENNEWERALIHAWRKHRHGQLIAVAHSTVRFWDLRYFCDSREVARPGSYPMPEPDAIAVNGQAAMALLRGAGYGAASIVPCEAVRYLHLQRPSGRGTRTGPTRAPRRVLVIGDIMPEYTRSMFQLIAESGVGSSPSYDVVVKPHPANPVRAQDHPELRISVAASPLEELLASCDVAFASSTTSGAVDAWSAGVPVVVLLPPSELNFSPLRGQVGVRFVSTPAELAAALEDTAEASAPPSGADGYFFLDPALPRWRRIFSSPAATAAGVQPAKEDAKAIS